MDGLLFLLLLVWLFKYAKKKKGKQKHAQAQMWDGLKKAFETMQQNTESAPQVQKNQPLDARDAVPLELAEGQSHMQAPWVVHDHASAGEEYMGSLAADTSEGKDACDPSLGHEGFERNMEPCVYDGEIGSESPLDLSPRAVYQGFVMSEILQRPTIGRRIRH